MNVVLLVRADLPGLHGLNGTGPMVAMIQYNTYVGPTLLYGLEALVLRTDEIQPLDKFHRKCLRYIQHLPQSTANCALYLLLGVLPIEAQIHIKVLNFFRNIIDEENNSPPSEYMRNIIIRQLAMKENESSSWVTMVKKLLRIYGLPSVYTLLENTPKKMQWKKTLNEAVSSHWQKELKEEANTMSTMEFLNIIILPYAFKMRRDYLSTSYLDQKYLPSERSDTREM